MSRNQMIPIILNTSCERIAEADDFISFIWTQRFYSPGDFELCLDIRYANIIQKGFYIMRKGDLHAGIVEKIQFKRMEDSQEMIIVSGRMLTAILARRVISQQTQLEGNIISAIHLIINENAVNPSDSGRTISGIMLSNTSIAQTEINSQYTGENLLDTISSLCETYGVGFDGFFDDQFRFNFLTYDGVDRSYGQNVNPYVVFSEQYDNLLNCEFEADYTQYSTDVLVGGEGEGINRTFVWSAKDSQTGLNRYEKYLDASNAVSNDNIITQETYEKQLQGLGLEEITEFTEAFQGEVDFSGVNYGVDLNVGDIVTIENTRWGMRLNTRLIEVIESVGEDGAYTIVPTFGT